MKGGIACFVAAALDYLAAQRRQAETRLDLAAHYRRRGERRRQRHHKAPAMGGRARRKIRPLRSRRTEQHFECSATPSRPAAAARSTARWSSPAARATSPIPDRADNPIRGLVTLIAALQAPLDEGSEHFDPSNLEFTSVDVGNPTVNLIPGEARARFNIRYNDRHSQTALKTLIEQRAQAAAAGRIHYSFEWQPSNADVFVTKPGPFTDLAAAAIAEVTGIQAEALHHRRHVGRALHQGLLPGARIRPRRTDHACGRRMRAGRRPRCAHGRLSADYREIFRLLSDESDRCRRRNWWLSLALSLHQAGIEARVYEAVRDLVPLGVGINLQPAAVRELAELGLGDELARTGIATQALSLFNKFGQLIWSEPRGYRGRIQLAAILDPSWPTAIRPAARAPRTRRRDSFR